MYKLSVFDKHQIKIAKQTLGYSDVGAGIMGGMTKPEARAILRKFGIKFKENPGAAWHEEQRIEKINEATNAKHDSALFLYGAAAAHKDSIEALKYRIHNPIKKRRKRNRTQDIGNAMGFIAAIALPILLIYGLRKKPEVQ